jgi:hypothetical protein
MPTNEVEFILYTIAQVATFGAAFLTWMQSRANKRTADANSSAIAENTKITRSVEKNTNGVVAALHDKLDVALSISAATADKLDATIVRGDAQAQRADTLAGKLGK